MSNSAWFLSVSVVVLAAILAGGAQTQNRITVSIVKNRTEGPATMERGLADRLRELGCDVAPTSTVQLTPEEDRQYGAWNKAAIERMFRHPKVGALGIASIPFGERDKDGISLAAAHRLIEGAVAGVRTR